MSRRASLTTMKLAPAACDPGCGPPDAHRDESTAAKTRSAAEPETSEKGIMTTAIVLPKRTYALLRAVALKRAAAGGRLSVSAVIVALAEKHRGELEREAGT